MDRRVQILLQVCSLLMLGLLVAQVRSDEWSAVNYLMLGIAGGCCLLIFLRFIYIFNYSYSLAAMLNGAMLAVARPSAATLLLGGAAMLYGARLFLFSWSRQAHASYAAHVRAMEEADRHLPGFARALLWFSCTMLYTYQLMAVYVASRVGELTPGIAAGGAVMIGGVLLEALGDRQKQRVKRQSPDQPVLDGLYRYVRHPNYLGEILLQAGLLVAGLSVASGITEILMVTLAPAYIIVLMVIAAYRADADQASRYGQHPGYAAQRARTGTLLPRIGAATRESSSPGET